MTKKTKINDIVIVIGDTSVLNDLLGCIGIVTNDYGDKCSVLFKARVGNIGSFSHTVLKNELQKIGSLDPAIAYNIY